MEETGTTLPDDCWKMILHRINEGRDIESFSLVSKQFLSMANSAQVSLEVFSPSIQILSRQLQRFTNLKRIKLRSFLGDFDMAMQAIAQSGLDVEELDFSGNEIQPTVCFEELGAKMKNLKVLNCSSSSLTDVELVRVANSFPYLEELFIRASCWPRTVDARIIAVTDEGIKFLSLKLKRLRKIDLSGTKSISDKSLICLSRNCALLEKITVSCSRDVTETGISFIVHNTRHLNSLVINQHMKLGSFGEKGYSNFSKSLQSLYFTNLDISDEFLYSITEANIPLAEFALSFCKGYTFTGISLMLQSYKSLKSLALLGVEFLTNDHIEQLSQYLHNLTNLSLHFCPKLSDSAFAILAERCPYLNHLEMGHANLGREEYDYGDGVKNMAIKSLNLSRNQYLSSGLRRILNICPSLENLNLYSCYRGKEQLDLADILEYSSGIKTLAVASCGKMKFSRENTKITKLKRLEAQLSGIDDEVLTMIGRNCPELVHLNLDECENVTEEGVKQIVTSCTKLRYLNLTTNANMNTSIISWIVFTRPSLRQLVSPSHLYPENEEQKRYFEHGCLVYRGEDYDAIMAMEVDNLKHLS